MVLYHYCALHISGSTQNYHSGPLTLDKSIETVEEYEATQKLIRDHLCPHEPGKVVVLVSLNRLGGTT